MAPDPYKYFRVEARELLDSLAHGVLELEKGTAEPGHIGSMLRLAHTLKGAARVVRQPATAELAHGIEDLLAPYRDDSRPVPGDRVREMLQILDQIGSGLASLGSQAEPSPRLAARPGMDEPLDTIRVETEDIETLLARLSEIGAEFVRFEHEVEEVRRIKRTVRSLVQHLHSRHDENNSPDSTRLRTLAEQTLENLQAVGRRLGESVERAGRELRESRGLAGRMRLLPAAAIFPALARVARDAAATQGKRVEFQTAGGDIRLDAQVLTILRSALSQLVRNAVAHGIEDVGGRVSAGKQPSGLVELRIERRGNRVVFRCCDDGGGIDLGAIRRVAVQKGIISAASADGFGLREAIDILFRGGLSTASHVDEISGRGIGLDIVRAAVTRLKGEISVETAAGRGTMVEICVPASLTSLPALTVSSDGIVASIPLDCVRRIARFEAPDIARCGVHESLAYDGQSIPFLRLSYALKNEVSSMPPLQRGSVVIVAAGASLAAIGVDRLIETGVVIVRALPQLAPSAKVVSGVTLDNDGNPQVFLDPAELLEIANQGQRAPRRGDIPRVPILVVDDSLTTRMVEESILESAGYPVELATSGEEAMEMALARQYCLFLVDVEMPGMDGFEFISRARSDPALREIPSILVTSRMSSDDRRRGVECGANAYIVKSEFDQNHFLQTIQQLVSP